MITRDDANPTAEMTDTAQTKITVGMKTIAERKITAGMMVIAETMVTVRKIHEEEKTPSGTTATEE